MEKDSFVLSSHTHQTKFIVFFKMQLNQFQRVDLVNLSNLEETCKFVVPEWQRFVDEKRVDELLVAFEAGLPQPPIQTGLVAVMFENEQTKTLVDGQHRYHALLRLREKRPDVDFQVMVNCITLASGTKVEDICRRINNMHPFRLSKNVNVDWMCVAKRIVQRMMSDVQPFLSPSDRPKRPNINLGQLTEGVSTVLEFTASEVDTVIALQRFNLHCESQDEEYFMLPGDIKQTVSKSLRILKEKAAKKQKAPIYFGMFQHNQWISCVKHLWENRHEKKYQPEPSQEFDIADFLSDLMLHQIKEFLPDVNPDQEHMSGLEYFKRGPHLIEVKSADVYKMYVEWTHTKRSHPPQSIPDFNKAIRSIGIKLARLRREGTRQYLFQFDWETVHESIKTLKISTTKKTVTSPPSHSRKFPVRKQIRKSKRKAFKEAERIAVWDKYVGEDARKGKCFVCQSVISLTHFEVGHVKAVAKGGSDEMRNLRPVCSLCNRSCGTENMSDFSHRIHTIRHE